MSRTCVFLIAVCIIVTGGAIRAETTASSPSSGPSTAPSVSTAPSASPASLSGGPVQTSRLRIVFVDKEVACACTRKAVDAGWKTLQSVVGPKPAVPIKRLFLDKQPAEVAVYRSKRPMVALPAIYVLDKSDKIVGMVQGEVKPEELKKLLQ
jgi:hypothetical protein